jgi:hypothetical protein
MDDKDVAVYQPAGKYMTAIGVVGTAKDGYVGLDDYREQAAELAVWREKEAETFQKYVDANEARIAAESQLAQAVAERDGVRVDAERYRWLCGNFKAAFSRHTSDYWVINGECKTPTIFFTEEHADLTLNAAIDAARDAGGREG